MIYFECFYHSTVSPFLSLPNIRFICAFLSSINILTCFYPTYLFLHELCTNTYLCYGLNSMSNMIILQSSPTTSGTFLNNVVAEEFRKTDWRAECVSLSQKQCWCKVLCTRCVCEICRFLEIRHWRTGE